MSSSSVDLRPRKNFLSVFRGSPSRNLTISIRAKTVTGCKSLLTLAWPKRCKKYRKCKLGTHASLRGGNSHERDAASYLPLIDAKSTGTERATRKGNEAPTRDLATHYRRSICPFVDSNYFDRPSGVVRIVIWAWMRAALSCQVKRDTVDALRC